MVDWQHEVDRQWGSVRFGDLRVETDETHHVFEVEVFLGDLDPQAVRVELYADGSNGGEPVREEMKRVRPLADASDGYVYGVTVSAVRPPGDYTARVIPHCEGAAIPLEDARIVWQR
jgi:starch phosphorylase